MTLWSRGPARSYDELKTYIYYHDTNDLQNEIQWGGEIQWEVPIHKAYGHVRSCDKLKTYIHFHNACHTCKCGDILQGTHTHKFAWPLNEVTWHKINLLYLHLQKPHEHWIRQDADLLWKAPSLKATRTFDYISSVSSCDNFENLCLYFHKTYGH